MSILVWDAIGDRTYESGVDRGVIYLPFGSPIPWNGLTSVTEKFEKDTESVYFDGRKIHELTHPGNFAASMSAVTYPDELTQLEGYGEIRNGVFIGDQPPQVFDLSYRTKIGNDLDPDKGYKIHIVYNVTAIPSDKTYDTISDSPSLVQFQWDIYATPEEIPGFRPTAHFIIDSTVANAGMLTAVEAMLYGTDEVDASLLPIEDFISLVTTYSDIQILDNGDGTWTLNTILPDIVTVDVDGMFVLTNVDAENIDANTYTITDS